MEFVRDFKRLNKNDAAIAGGKGASLGEMTQAGIPVPPGFVILSNAFEQFIEEAELKADIDAALHAVNHAEMHTVEKAAEEIKALILEEKIPKDIAKEIQKQFKKLNAKFVAVRSSATAEDSSEAAWAGQLESYLNTTEKNLLENVKRCWASLFTPRAIFYRFEKGLHKQHISVAVVVQKMVESEKSGIGFSVHPVTQDYNQLIIEAGFGLGEAIVSGSITPDNYVVEKKGWLILDIHVSTQSRALVKGKSEGNDWIDLAEEKGKQQVLNESEIIELSKLIVKIEQHYGFPVDVEWAFEKGKFFIVQSRPITTLQKQKPELAGALVIGGEKWNIFVSRSMSFWHHVLSNYGHFHKAKDWGMKVPLRLLFLTEHGTLTHAFKTKENAVAVDADVLQSFSSKKKIERLKKNYKQFADDLFKQVLACKKSFTIKNWQRFSEAYALYTHGLALTATMGRIGMEKLMQKLKEVNILEDQLAQTVSVVTYPKNHTPLFDSSLDLLKIGVQIQKGKLKEPKLKIALQKWLQKHGYIPVNFCDEPWTLTDAEKQLNAFLQKDCAKELKVLNQSHVQRIQAAKETLKKLNNPEVSTLALALQEATFLNEFRKNVFSKVSLEMRPLFEKIAHKANLPHWRKCYYLMPNEIIDILDNKLKNAKKIVENRKIVAMVTRKNGETVFLNLEETKKVMNHLAKLHQTTQMVSQEQTIKGFSASSGIARGIAKIILTSNDFSKLQPNEILITTMTSVDFVPIMEKAAAFVTNEGGITSHASIVAREMNKPCIIGTKNATQVLKDGDFVEVDANKGIVKILEKSVQ